jgi:hypothetical protein
MRNGMKSSLQGLQNHTNFSDIVCLCFIGAWPEGDHICASWRCELG